MSDHEVTPWAKGQQIRALILGASGWFGRTVATILGEDVPTLGTASSNRGRFIAFDLEQIRRFSPTLVVNCAFLTRERVVTDGVAEFTRVNKLLTQQFLDAASLSQVQAAVTISSGAAITEPHHPYGALKAEEEVRALALKSTDRSVVVARAYSVSGPLVRRPREYALSDFILQAFEGEVTVRASRPTFRRYVSVTDYMKVCVSEAVEGRSGVIESGGPLLEMGELAQRVVEVVNPNARLKRARLKSDEPSIYASNDIQWKQACARQGLSPANIQQQIRETAHGLVSLPG